MGIFGRRQHHKEEEPRRRARDHGTAGDGESDDRIVFSWMDVLAFTIAAYQVLFPFLLAILATGGILYFLFWLWTR